jgi:DNA-binding MarR family transcriptional regulator
MDSLPQLHQQVIKGLGEYNLSTVLFRNAISRRLGLNTADMECLNLLSLKGISTPTELSRYTGLTTGSVTAMLDRLEKARLITRKPNPADRRGVHIEVSPNLSEIVRPAFAEMQQIQKRLIASYSDEELKTIADFLTRFSQNLKDYTESID